MATKLPVEFTPVPVRYRHDGWTLERQRGDRGRCATIAPN
jgi:hypothetical protein